MFDVLKKKGNDLGVFLAERLRLDRPGKGKQELRQELIALSVGDKSAVKKYYSRKILVFLLIIAAGLMLSVLCLLVFYLQDGQTELRFLLRPGYGEGDRKESLEVQAEGEDQKKEMEITIRQRIYTAQEKRKFLDEALAEAEELLPGENGSLDRVQSDLVFPSVLQDGAVRVSWTTTPYGVIQEDGKLLSAENEEGTLVEIQAVLNCDGEEAIYEVCARVFPPDLTPEEEWMKALQKEVEKADAQNRHEEELVLPESVEGKTITWMKPMENPFAAVFAMTMLTAVCAYLHMDSQVHKKAEERRHQLLLDYPDLMWKMTMLLGAGMSIRGVFFRISEEYMREKKREAGNGNPRKIRYVYEEVSYACFEMQSGIGEAQAYERFGKRCQLPEYIRMGSVLSQNLRKGAKGLRALLETEAESSLNERKNHARKFGEEAGTKLLLPMILMLGIVLAVLMVPAFLSF